MLTFVVFDTISKVPEAFWNTKDTDFCGLYRTKGWLSDSQWRLGDAQFFVGAYQQSIPLALFPIVLMDADAGYQRYEPTLILQRAEIQRTGRIALCASLFGTGRAFRFAQNDIQWEPLVEELGKLLKDRYQCTALIFANHTVFDDPFMQIKITKRVMLEPLGMMNIARYGGWEGYLSSLKRKVRESFRREHHALEEGNITLQVGSIADFDPEVLEKLAINVYKKYNSEIPAGRIISLVSHLKHTFPKNTYSIAAMQNDIIISYVVFITYEDTIYVRWHGRDYDRDHYQTYYTLVYHEPIKWGFEKGYSYIDYGYRAQEAKLRRNIEMTSTYGYILDLHAML